MGDPCYALPSDLILPSASSVTLVGTAASGYPLTAIYDGVPDTPFKMTTAAAFSVDADRGASGAFGLAAFFNHNLDAGLAATVKTASNSGFSTALTSDALTIPAGREDGMPSTPFVDVSARTNRYVRLDVTGTNSVAPAIGEWVLTSAKRVLSPISSWRYGMTEHERRPVQRHEGELGIGPVYDYGITRRFIEGEFQTTAAGVAQLRTLWRSVRGPTLPFLWIPDDEINEAWFVRFVSDIDVHWADKDWFTVSMTFDEVSAGVPV